MMNCEWGWCQHVMVLGFQRKQGGTCLKITSNLPTYMYWLNQKMCIVLCEDCYRKENPILVQPSSLRCVDTQGDSGHLQ